MNTQDLKSGITDTVPDALQDGLGRAGDAVSGAVSDLAANVDLPDIDLGKAQDSVAAAAEVAGKAARKQPAAAVAAAVLAALALILIWRRLA